MEGMIRICIYLPRAKRMFCLGAPGMNLVSAPLLSHTIFERQSIEQMMMMRIETLVLPYRQHHLTLMNIETMESNERLNSVRCRCSRFLVFCRFMSQSRV